MSDDDSRIQTRVGRSGFHDYDHFGLRVYRDLAGRTSYLGLIAFAVSGRRLSSDDEGVLDDLAVCAHVPEPRVWPMKLSRVAASAGRAMSGFLSGSTVLDSDLLGGRVSEDAAQTLIELRAHLDRSRSLRASVDSPTGLAKDSDASDDDTCIRDFLSSRKRLVGFGVPFRPVDERVVATRRCLEQRGRTTGSYWQLGERLWRVVNETRGVPVNVIGATAAVLLDLGFVPGEIAPMAAILLQPTLLSNAVEGAMQQSPALRRLPEEAVRYVGPEARRSPRSQVAKG